MAEIVLAEDDDDIRAITAAVLHKAGHHVRAVPDGATALREVRQRRPDLVVTNIELPVTTGIDVCRKLRADPATAELPVLLVSGGLLPGDDRPRDVRATAVLAKPFRHADLTTCVNKLLQAGHTDGRAPVAYP
uniref:response regulator n=1 Tax=Paractinoplanes polyasparticus TaxID=2856853 RepID=UPI001C8601AB|nr:response regulator [Actinoplanes polyasparticus]